MKPVSLCVLGLICAALALSLCTPNRTTVAAPKEPANDLGAALSACEAKLPSGGGTCDLRHLDGRQRISSEVVLDRPTTVLFGHADIEIVGGLKSAIRIIAPSRIVMEPGKLPEKRPGRLPASGTVFRAGPGFGGFFIEVEGENNWSTAMETSIEGGGFDGNDQQASAIRVRNQLGVQIRNILANRVEYGIVIENTRHYAEASHLDNVWLYDPKIAGIDLRVSAKSTSFANFTWGRIYVELETDGSVGLRTDPKAEFENGIIQFFKVWSVGTLRTGQTGILLQGDGIRSSRVLFATVNCEADNRGSGAVYCVKMTVPDAVSPMFLNLTVQGAPKPIIQLGSGAISNRLLRDNQYAIVSSGRSLFDPTPDSAAPSVSFIGREATGLYYEPQQDGVGFSSGGHRVGWIGSQWKVENGLKIGAGPAITAYLAATARMHFQPWRGADCQERTVPVLGAAENDDVALGLSPTLAKLPGVQFTAFVSARNQVTVRGCKITAGGSAQTPESDVSISVWQHAR
jgi:hypothetical protein